MAINVAWNTPATLVGQLGQRTGAGQLRAEQQLRDLENERFLLGLQEQQRQFDTRAAIGVAEADARRRQQDQALAAQTYGQQQQLAAQMFDRDQTRQAALANQEMQLESQAAAREYDYAGDSIEGMEKAAQEYLSRFRNANLTPEGKRKYHEASSSLAAIMGGRGVSIRDGEPYAGTLGQWLRKAPSLGLEEMVEDEPTPGKIYTVGGQPIEDGDSAPWGYYKEATGMRNGVPTYDQFFKPPQTPDEVADWEARQPVRPGYKPVWKANGETEWLAEPKPETPKADPNEITLDTRLKARRDAFAELDAIARAEAASGGTYTRPDDKAIKARMADILGEDNPAQAAAKRAGYTGDISAEPPVPVAGPDEAAMLPVGSVFSVNGKLFLKVGPNEAEPL